MLAGTDTVIIENSREIYKILKNRTIIRHEPVIPFLGIDPKEMKSHHKDIPCSSQHLFTLAKAQKQTNYL